MNGEGQFKKVQLNVSSDDECQQIFGDDQPQKQTLTRLPEQIKKEITQNTKLIVQTKHNIQSEQKMKQKPQIYQLSQQQHWGFNDKKYLKRQRFKNKQFSYFNPEKLNQNQRNYQGNQNNYNKKNKNNYQKINNQYHQNYNNTKRQPQQKNFYNQSIEQNYYNHRYQKQGQQQRSHPRKKNQDHNYDRNQCYDYSDDREFKGNQNKKYNHHRINNKRESNVYKDEDQYQNDYTFVVKNQQKKQNNNTIKNKRQNKEQKQQNQKYKTNSISNNSSKRQDYLSNLQQKQNSTFNHAKRHIQISKLQRQNQSINKSQSSDWCSSNSQKNQQNQNQQKSINQISHDQLSLSLPPFRSCNQDSGLLDNQSFFDQSLIDDVKKISEILKDNQQILKIPIKDQKLLKKQSQNSDNQSDLFENSIVSSKMVTEQDLKIIEQLFKKNQQIPYKVVELKISSNCIQKLKIKRFTMNILGYQNVTLKSIKPNILLKIIQNQKIIPRDHLNKNDQKNKNQQFKINFIQFKDPLDLLTLKQNQPLSKQEKQVIEKLQKLRSMKKQEYLQIDQIKMTCKVCSQKKMATPDQGSVTTNCQQNCKNILKFTILSVNFITL